MGGLKPIFVVFWGDLFFLLGVFFHQKIFPKATTTLRVHAKAMALLKPCRYVKRLAELVEHLEAPEMLGANGSVDGKRKMVGFWKTYGPEDTCWMGAAWFRKKS